MERITLAFRGSVRERTDTGDKLEAMENGAGFAAIGQMKTARPNKLTKSA